MRPSGNLSKAVSRALLVCYAGLVLAVLVFALSDIDVLGLVLSSIPCALLTWFGSRRPISAGFLLALYGFPFGAIGLLFIDGSGWTDAPLFAWLFAPALFGIALMATGAFDAWRRRKAERAYWETEIETRPPLPNP
jgi:hypothetical protein